ncbi:MAG: hypothetical protein K6G33_12390 [Ruminococcus sp.]|uniref:JAB domain-containing protein n=1 Tax=Ruminococcus sp. TaxID=41978 RepID=UPI0025FDF57A|nr:JAB domain-containing protein [Ruminococcus sp.]MCR5601527.1 hypothetical protein [Ruminococcus sp.]
MNGKNPHAGHRERFRQRFLNSEFDRLYEHELLELMLFYPRPVVNTNNISHALVDRFGSLSKVLTAERDELRDVKGVGSGGALFLKMMHDFGLDYLRRVNNFDTLSTQEQLYDFLSQKFCGSDAKLCILLCLGPRSELADTVTLPAADICNGIISQKELASMLLRSSASKVCAGINHGNGIPLPDDNDYLLAHTLAKLLSAIGIGFSDCIIFGSGNCFSMREKGAFAF